MNILPDEISLPELYDISDSDLDYPSLSCMVNLRLGLLLCSERPRVRQFYQTTDKEQEFPEVIAFGVSLGTSLILPVSTVHDKLLI